MDFSNKTAMLVIDMQYDSLPDGFYPVWNMESVVANIAKVIDACRRQGLPIIYSQHTYRPDGIDTALGEPRDEAGRPKAYIKNTRGWEIVEALRPHDDDIVIEKTRWSAFFLSPLEVFLRGLRVQQLIIAGVVTDGCVQTTVYDAFFRDYPVILAKDACGAYNRDCHEAAVLNMVNWVYGMTVISSDDLVNALESRPYHATGYVEPNSKPFSAETLRTLYEGL